MVPNHSAERNERSGLHCTAEELVEYANGSQDHSLRARVEEHVKACQLCADDLDEWLSYEDSARKGSESPWMSLGGGERILSEPICVTFSPETGLMTVEHGPEPEPPGAVEMFSSAPEKSARSTPHMAVASDSRERQQAAAVLRATRAMFAAAQHRWSLEDKRLSVKLEMQVLEAAKQLFAVRVRVGRPQQAQFELHDHERIVYAAQLALMDDIEVVEASGLLSNFERVPARVSVGRWILRIALPTAPESFWILPIEIASAAKGD